MKFNQFTFFALLVLTGACSGPKTVSETLDVGDRNTETIAIVGTNDIHGALAPLSLKSRESDDIPPVAYEAGGVATLASYIDILRSELSSRLLWLDAGDEFQGTIESNAEKGAPMVRFYNTTGLHAAAVGNHEFDYGPENDPSNLLGAIKARMSEAQYPYLAANIVDKETGNLPAFPNTHRHILVNVGTLKVGILGLSTLDTPTTTRPDHVKTLSFTHLKDATLKEAKALREAGADVVVVTAHVGLKCGLGRMTPAHTLRRETDPQGECGDQDEMVRLLRSLPAGTVDAVVSGHSHQIVHHWVAGTPVIQGGANGRYLNVIYLTFDLDEKKLLKDQTRIEGPIPVCPKVFKNQNDCNGDRPAPAGKGGRGPLVNHKFHGETIEPNSAVLDLLEPAMARSEAIKKEIVGKAARPLDHDRFHESSLGNLVSDAIREAAKTDVSLVNSGGIRAPLEAGPITYGSVFRTLPFDNSVSKLTLTGKELKLLIRIAESGARGFHPMSGLQMKVIHPAYDAPASDLDRNGSIELWEINRLISARFANGKPILENGRYTVAIPDFLVNGGDDMKWFMAQIPANRKILAFGPVMRDAAVQHIRQLSQQEPINTIERPLMDPKRPRLILVKRGAKASVKKRLRR